MSPIPRWRAACSAFGLLTVLGTTAPAGAQTLADALARVYAENPQILAERARVEPRLHLCCHGAGLFKHLGGLGSKSIDDG
jgi:hypothetical protein